MTPLLSDEHYRFLTQNLIQNQGALLQPPLGSQAQHIPRTEWSWLFSDNPNPYPTIQPPINEWGWMFK